MKQPAKLLAAAAYHDGVARAAAQQLAGHSGPCKNRIRWNKRKWRHQGWAKAIRAACASIRPVTAAAPAAGQTDETTETPYAVITMARKSTGQTITIPINDNFAAALAAAAVDRAGQEVRIIDFDRASYRECPPAFKEMDQGVFCCDCGAQCTPDQTDECRTCGETICPSCSDQQDHLCAICHAERAGD